VDGHIEADSSDQHNVEAIPHRDAELREQCPVDEVADHVEEAVQLASIDVPHRAGESDLEGRRRRGAIEDTTEALLERYEQLRGHDERLVEILRRPPGQRRLRPPQACIERDLDGVRDEREVCPLPPGAAGSASQQGAPGQLANPICPCSDR
jgi:hypothetical protein